MAAGRTVSAKELTGFDKKVIRLCRAISDAICKAIPKSKRKAFRKDYGKIDESRDAGTGRSGAKLQRDALCTRGKAGKAPFSNRNFRWHPLVVAENIPSFAREIERIDIRGNDDKQDLIFVVKRKGTEARYRPGKVHKLRERFAVLPKHWEQHVTGLTKRPNDLWTRNSCVIPALEACDWQDAVETYAVLGVSISVNFYGADFDNVYRRVVKCLNKQAVDSDKQLPSPKFPKIKDDILQCPLCHRNISDRLEDFRDGGREEVWKPPWSPNRRREGDDSSIQIMHVDPLLEKEIRHTADNVRYGHRWCNIAMTDHSLGETLRFMTSVVRANDQG